jgi:hypothetical protein
MSTGFLRHQLQGIAGGFDVPAALGPFVVG